VLQTMCSSISGWSSVWLLELLLLLSKSTAGSLKFRCGCVLLNIWELDDQGQYTS